MTSLLRKLSLHKKEELVDDIEATTPMIKEGDTTRNTPSTRPPEEVAAQWKELHALERRYAEEEKKEAKAIAEMEKESKELQKSETKARKAVEKAETELDKARKHLEKHEAASSKHQEATEECAKAKAELDAKRAQRHEAVEGARLCAEKVERTKADQVTRGRDRKADLEATVPRDKFKLNRTMINRIPPGLG